MKRDLVVLVPDADIEFGLRGVLERPESLGIRAVPGVMFVREPHRDPGVYNRARAALHTARSGYDHALVVLDESWAGSPGAASIESEVEARCRPDWSENVRCVCIAPEIESWVWSDSPHVANALGWSETAELRRWLEHEGLWTSGRSKPADPKAAVAAALRAKRIPRSADLYRRIAARVSFTRCEDPAFGRLCAILRSWFPDRGRLEVR